MTIEIAGRKIGEGHPAYIVAEAGINANGSVQIACELVRIAADAGCDAIKFQKRTVDKVYSAEELAKPRESPWGTTTREQKEGLEFGRGAYEAIARECEKRGIAWFASPWDVESVDFLVDLGVPAMKVASALITDLELMRKIGATKLPVILSTGMSTFAEVEAALDALGEDARVVLLHAVSTYPCEDHEINLRVMRALQIRFGLPVGYSGHERGIATSVAAVALGACMVERHVTLDRTMYGSDQAASLEPEGLRRLVRDIRAVESALGDGEKRILPSEIPVMAKLRRRTA